MKLIEKLDTILAHPRKNGITSGRVVSSLRELRENGFARTGLSEKRRSDVWTDDVVEVLTSIGINCESGNDAPRGGKNGEFVRITSPAILREIKAEKERRKAEQLHSEQIRQKRIEFRERCKENLPNILQQLSEGKHDEHIRKRAERLFCHDLAGGEERRRYWKKIAHSLHTVNTEEFRNAYMSRAKEIL